ncbi:DUF1854 domain-containing protein [Uliginosibacterium paludis]|uniref:DUF1854 domain-containing protein n=1 Tax=Uliginosibacterium paludis TaxID=1615952 RepID=A0ABV2CSZ7_9RHOO
MSTAAFSLERDAFGQLILIDAAGQRHEGVLPVRAHPVSAPLEGIALVGSDGHEAAWIEHLDTLPAGLRALIEEELESREFMPEIQRLDRVSSFATPSAWEVQTSRGPTRFILKGEEDIRRLPGGVLLISDAHGIQFMIRRLSALDRHSRKLLDRFL